MSRIMLTDFEGDLKTLKRSSKLMRNRDFGGLVQAIEKFHRDVKLSSLTIKDRTQLIHLGEDAQFFRILIRMLHEVTITTGLKQREDLKKVLQWYQTNKEVLHGHPHFKGATKELYKKPSLTFSKDAIKHYSVPVDKRKKKRVTMATEPRSKSAIATRSKPRGTNKGEGNGCAEEGKEGGGVAGARPLTAPPGLNRPKITNSLSTNDSNTKPVLEENSFMVNYVNNKLASYNHDPAFSRPSSAIGVARASHELDSSEDNSSKAATNSQVLTPNASLDSFTSDPPLGEIQTQAKDSHETGSIPDSEQTENTKEGEVEFDERGLPKVIYPLPSLISPFSQGDFVDQETYHGGQSPDRRSKSPLKLHVKVNVPVAGNEQSSVISPEEKKAANLQKWQEFQARQAFEQELAAKQAFFGRGGDPTGMRYTGHDGGEMPEWYTQDVISNYAADEGLYYQQARTGDAFTSQELEEFYQATEKYSPPVRPSSKASMREGTTPAPPASVMSTEMIDRGYIPDDVASDIQNRTAAEAAEHERDHTSQSVHFESVVDLAGPVSDAMTVQKEMISPEPQLGYRQPALAITVKPPPTVQIQAEEQPTSPPPQSVYKMASEDGQSAVAPPNSSRFSGSGTMSEYTQRNKKGEPIILLPEESEYTVHFRRKPRPVSAAIIPHAISRQTLRAQSSTPKYKWGLESLGEDQLSGLARTKSAPSRRSLRSAGTTRGGQRPRTAIETSIKERWNLHHDNDNNHRVPQAASHIATTMPPRAVSSLMVVSHLGGDNRRARSRMGYRGLKGYDEKNLINWASHRKKRNLEKAKFTLQNLPGFLPDMQFLSITKPAPMQARGQGDGIVIPTEDPPSSTESKTPSENASTHPHPDNLTTQQWMGLSMSSENPEQLSDPFSRKGETDSLDGGDASERSSLLSDLEDGEGTDRMKDLEGMESEGGPDGEVSHRDGDGDNDTPRTMDADLDSDLEAAENDAARTTDFDGDDSESKEQSMLRTIDVDMRSVSQINTEHGDDQSTIESQISEQLSTNTKEEQQGDSKDVREELNAVGDDANDVQSVEDKNSQTGEGDELDSEQNGRTAPEPRSTEEQNKNLEGSSTPHPAEVPSEKDILTGAEKADLLSRSFLAVTRHRRVERPSSAHPSLCPTHKVLEEELYHKQEKGRSGSPANGGGRAVYNGGAFYPEGRRPGSGESVRSLPIGLTYMPLTDEHRTQLEKTVPILDAHGFPMMPAVAKKPLTPRSTPTGSPRGTPIHSTDGSPRESRESFGDSPRGSRTTSPIPLVMKIHLDSLVNNNNGDSTSDSDADSIHHFRPITMGDEQDERDGKKSTLPPPPNILVRRPTSAPHFRSTEHDNVTEESPKRTTSRPISARHRSESSHPATSPRPTSARSPRSLSPNPGAVSPGSPRSLSPRPNSARRPRSASPRSRSVSPRPSSAKELRVTSPVPQRPSSPRGHSGPEWKGRPLSVYGVKDPITQEEEYKRQQEAKNAVSIQSLFNKSTAKGHKRELSRQEKERQERKRKEMLQKQRNYNEHMWRRDMALINHKSLMNKDWERDYMIDKLFRERMRQEKWSALKQQQAMENRKAQSYLKRIGPSVDIWELFNGEKRGVSRAQFKKAAVILQRYIRGWIVRSMLKKVIKKSRVHAGSFKSFVKYYNKLLKRIARWHGIKKPRIHADLWEMDDFMDRKRYYESVFVNRTHPGDEMDVKDIDLFFKECDHFPSKREVYNAILGATKKDPDKPHLKLQELDVVETAFMIYVPQGTGLKTENLRKSTWLNPLVDGEEARKLMGSEHVEQTSYLTSIQVVAASLQERKARQLEEIKREAKKSEEAAAKKAAEEQAMKSGNYSKQ